MKIDFRFWKQVGVSLMVVLVTLLMQIPIITVTAEQSFCVKIDEGIPGGRTWLADPVTGSRTEEQPSALELEMANAEPSPNQDYLIVRNNSTHKLTILEHSSYRQLRTIDHAFKFAWSPDSRSIAYFWEDSQSQLWLTVSSVLGDQQHTKQVPSALKADIGNLLWSNDGQFLLASPRSGEGYTPLQFYFWSVSDLALTQIDTHWSSPYERPVWSTRNHFLAFIGGDSQGKWYVGIVSPTNSKRLQFQLPSLPSNARIDWSPDNAHLLLGYGYGQYDIVGLDGSSMWDIAGIAQGASSRTGAVWAKDGQFLYITEESFGYSGRQIFYKTVVFHINTKKHETVVQNALEPFVYGSENIISIDNNGKKAVVLLDRDGRLLRSRLIISERI
jgi:hypothetical protein